MKNKYNLKDIYLYYRANGGTLNKTEYKNVCQDFNIGIMKHLIEEAGFFNMGHNLSTVSILRQKRNYKNPQVDWGESNAYKKELEEKGEKLWDGNSGTKWLIYHTDTWYCMFYWKKFYAKVKNKSAYRFRATRGEFGNKTRLKEHLAKSKLNYIKYQNAHLLKH